MYLAIVLVTGQGSIRWGPWKVLGKTFSNFWVGELPGTVTFCSWLQTILISSYSWIFFSVFSMATKVQIWGPLLVPAFFYLGILSQTTAVESSFFPQTKSYSSGAAKFCDLRSLLFADKETQMWSKSWLVTTQESPGCPGNLSLSCHI